MFFWRDLKTINPCRYEKTATKSKTKTMGNISFWQKKSSEDTERSEKQAANTVTCTEEETEAFENDMEAKNTKKYLKYCDCRFTGFVVGMKENNTKRSNSTK